MSKPGAFLYLTRDDGCMDDEVKVWICEPSPAGPEDNVMQGDDAPTVFWTGETPGSMDPFSISLRDCADMYGYVPDPGSMKVLPVGKREVTAGEKAARKYRKAITEALAEANRDDFRPLIDRVTPAFNILSAALKPDGA